MPIHAPFHPFQNHPWTHAVDFMNLLFILLGLLVALFLSPVHLD